MPVESLSSLVKHGCHPVFVSGICFHFYNNSSLIFSPLDCYINYDDFLESTLSKHHKTSYDPSSDDCKFTGSDFADADETARDVLDTAR